jgi:predicted acyl esterase
MLSRGYLKASHRALDKTESKPYAPYHPHTKESVKPVKPGEITEYAIAILPIAHVFKTGHRLELEIRNTESIKDPLFNDIWPCGYHLPISKTVAHWIYQDAKHQSHMYVPVIPKE